MAKFFYKVTNYYSPAHERVLRWNDSNLAIDWMCNNPIISDKDMNNAISLNEALLS